LTAYLSEHVVPQAWTDEQVKAAVYQRLRALAIEPPTSQRLDRIIASAAHTFEGRFCTATLEQLPAAILTQMDALLSLAAEGDEAEDPERSPFQQLKLDPGRVGIANVFAAIAKLKQLRQVGVPPEFFGTVAPQTAAAVSSARSRGEHLRDPSSPGALALYLDRRLLLAACARNFR
jgi:hypothetical protein